MLDDLCYARAAPTQTELRSFSAAFCFPKTTFSRRIGVLSGGERNRYALARMLLHPANFLCSTSPRTTWICGPKMCCWRRWRKFTGTVVFVSHDRYFIDKLATRIFEVGGGKFKIYPGNYEDYLWRKEGRQRDAPTLSDVPGARAPKAEPAVLKTAPEHPTNGNRGADAAGDAAKRRLNPIKRKQMEDRVHELEEEISRTESAIEHLETALQNFVSSEESQRQSQELDQHKATHAALLKEWEGLSEELQESK